MKKNSFLRRDKMSNVTIMGLTVEAGQRKRGEIHVAYMADGQPLVVPFWVINGMKPGTKLLLSAMTHGDAVIGAEAIYRTMETIDETIWPEEIRLLYSLAEK